LSIDQGLSNMFARNLLVLVLLGLRAQANINVDWSAPSDLLSNPLYGAPPNDFSCRSQVHPNPVILLHGLSSNREVGLNTFAHKLTDEGWCVYSLTYGAHTLIPWIGGVKSMRDDGAPEIADFIREVRDKTGAKKVDLVGHSEVGVMALYIPMTQDGIAEMVEHTVALGPAVHGAEYYGFTDLFYFGGESTRELASLALKTLGCAACDDMARGGQVYQDFQAADKIVPEGIQATVIMSTYDTLVAPEVSRVEEEEVRNVIVQDTCPDDKVGHAGLGWDKSVWSLVVNALTEDYDRPFECDQGLPF
jgi:pimeloyl-ACP methyl ester carboxylesterase